MISCIRVSTELPQGLEWYRSPKAPGFQAKQSNLENEELRGGPMEVGDRSNIPGKLSQFAMENHHFT